MTADEVIDGLLQREGGWRGSVQRPDGTWDPPTNKGITLPTLQRYHEQYLGWPASNPLTVQDLRDLTDELAVRIYTVLFIDEPGFTPENIPFEPLRVQLIDFGVNSGPERAVRWLQRVLRIPVTGKIDDATRSALDAWHVINEESRDFFELYYALVNDALVAARSYMIDQAVDQGAIRRQDEEGLESRALSFFLAKP